MKECDDTLESLELEEDGEDLKGRHYVFLKSKEIILRLIGEMFLRVFFQFPIVSFTDLYDPPLLGSVPYSEGFCSNFFLLGRVLYCLQGRAKYFSPNTSNAFLVAMMPVCGLTFLSCFLGLGCDELLSKCSPVLK